MSDSSIVPESGPLPQEISQHYATGYEAQRLSGGTSRLELARTQELIGRYLPSPPGVIFDVGGGPGVYACWLATRGYEVHLVDGMPLHVEQARQASREQPQHPLASIGVGDARHLDRRDESVDAVLLLGPLYHLTDRADRVQALREARRVLRPGGVLFAAAISRFASTLDGLFRGYLEDPEFVCIVQRDLTDGQHRNPANHPDYFTTAYFHLPGDLKSELKEASLRHEATLAVEGPGWLVADFEAYWSDPARRVRLLDAIRQLENEPSMLGVSAHVLAVGSRDSGGDARGS